MSIPKKLLNEILSDPFYQKCIRYKDGGDCDGRITFEHSLIYQGQQVQEKFAIVPLCEHHHSIGKHMEDGDLQKDYGQWVALNRATEQDFQKYYKSDWRQRLKLLNQKYGKY